MKTVVLTGFLNVKKVTLDKGFKRIFNIGLKQALSMTNQLLEDKSLTITDLTDEQVQSLKKLAAEAHVDFKAV